jgi:hypothetical protein
MRRRMPVLLVTVAICTLALYSITIAGAIASAPTRADELAIISEKTGLIASDSATSADCAFDDEYGVYLCPEPRPTTLPQRDAAAQARLQTHLAGGNSILLIPESTNDRVMAFDPLNGEPIDLDFVPADSTNLATPINAILSPAGDSILLSDQFNDDVLEYDLDGNFIGIYAGNNTAILDNILGIDLRPNGNLLVTVDSGPNQDTVTEFDTNGTYLGSFVTQGAGGLDGPFDIYPRAGTDWLVSSINPPTEAVLRYNYTTGAFIANLNTVNNFAEQVTTAANGDVLVANFSGTQEGIVRFTSGGTLVNVINPVTDGGYRGVYELGNGNLLVTTGTGVHEVTTAGAFVESEVTEVSARFIEEVSPNASGAAITLDKTVGTNSSTCATTDTIAVEVNSTVYYCYEVTNTGTITLTRHDLVDSELGVILNDFPFTLVPGASAFITQSATITQTTVNTATWTASLPPTPLNGPVTASATDVATVTIAIPSIDVNKTVGLSSSTCASTDEITIATTTTVYYCYEVENTGDITLTRHDLTDTELGTILNDFPFTLVPGASAFITQSATISQTTVNVAVWTAFNPGGGTANATDVATVTLEPPTAVTLSEMNATSGTLPVVVFAVSGLLLLAAAGVVLRKR